jgi:hypothetical protein
MEVTSLNQELFFENDIEKLNRLTPEPQNSLGSKVADSLNNIVSTLSSNFIPNMSTLPAGLNPEYTSLLNRQMEVQMQMQSVSMESNIERSKHEAQMTPIRNLRLG